VRAMKLHELLASHAGCPTLVFGEWILVLLFRLITLGSRESGTDLLPIGALFIASLHLRFVTSPQTRRPSPAASQTGCSPRSYSARRSIHPLSRWSRPWTAASPPLPAPPARSSAKYT